MLNNNWGCCCAYLFYSLFYILTNEVISLTDSPMIITDRKTSCKLLSEWGFVHCIPYGGRLRCDLQHVCSEGSSRGHADLTSTVLYNNNNPFALHTSPTYIHISSLFILSPRETRTSVFLSNLTCLPNLITQVWYPLAIHYKSPGYCQLSFSWTNSIVCPLYTEFSAQNSNYATCIYLSVKLLFCRSAAVDTRNTVYTVQYYRTPPNGMKVSGR